jgi:hypothetical protein
MGLSMLFGMLYGCFAFKIINIEHLISSVYIFSLISILFSISCYRFIIWSYIVFVDHSHATPIKSSFGFFFSLLHIEFIDNHTSIYEDNDLIEEAELLFQHIDNYKENNINMESFYVLTV